MFFFDKNSGGFYCLGIHPTIPAGAVEITAERHSELMLGVSGGKVIVADMEGYPLLADPPPPEPPSILAQIIDLETQQTPRRIREAALSPEGAAWLADLDAQITALRVQLSVED